MSKIMFIADLIKHIEQLYAAFPMACVYIDDADTGWYINLKTIKYDPEYNAIIFGGDYQDKIER